METFIINVPDQKSSLVTQLLKELGVEIQKQKSAKVLVDELSSVARPGKKPTMDEIVAEVKAYRAGK